MLELVAIFSTGGILLFYKAFSTLKFDVIDLLVKKILIQDKKGEQSYFTDPYRLKWTFANQYNLVFLSVYREIFQVQYVEELLEMLKQDYSNNMVNRLQIVDNVYSSIPSYEDNFVAIYQKWNTKQKNMEKKNSVMRSFQETQKGKKIQKPTTTTDKKKQEENKVEIKSHGDVTSHMNKSDISEENEEIQANRAKLKQRFSKKRTNSDENIQRSLIESSTTTTDKKKTQKKTEWGFKSSVSKKDMECLDIGKKLNTSQSEEKVDQKLRETYIEGGDKKIEGFYSNDDTSEEEEEKTTTKAKSFWGKIQSSIQNITGNKVIEEGETQQILAKFKEELMSKNVAEEISQKLCDSLKTELLDKKTQSYTSVYKTIKESLKMSLTKILTSNRQIDILKAAYEKRSMKKPYVMCFIGVNGVGKSTNLAKVAYLFKNNGFKVMLVACDNFRAGAIEQIKTHGRCLDIPVYDRGYKEDPAIIAQQAVKEAVQKQFDVVLIDTAGRMQDNEPLMKALSRLVILNQPDLITFIGEALTGNDAVDQLEKFNRSLVDLSPQNNIREIDAIILSKFDTVNDKVGAAITMTYTTGKPILFVGVGQKYPHLKKLNIKTVVHALLN